jgi:hypothetical protein
MSSPPTAPLDPEDDHEKLTYTPVPPINPLTDPFTYGAMLVSAALIRSTGLVMEWIGFEHMIVITYNSFVAAFFQALFSISLSSHILFKQGALRCRSGCLCRISPSLRV